MTAIVAAHVDRREKAHHQRCKVCGVTGRTTTSRSAVTFRYRHKKKCEGADFESA